MKWGSEDIIAIVIASSVCLMLLFIAIGWPNTERESLPPESAKLVAGLIGSLISILALYIGAKIRNRKD